ncbi:MULTISPECIES: hypothetical protein [Halorubrum]|uniref:Uncharacterized protein n=1 Tax=Halorubrum ezzemoulense TaxID=337243 RepID=A0A256JRP5_HALEZ|nr:MULTISPECIES: hypothetical protein [Halorubrum]MDB2274940.1 hypothetical protein [Halorubrum ezzemoulense]MDB2280703.1 hypothetical protein [Halorubrum ezzemoulense]MDB9251318.1 hypothetical protein [Halorubrum ezzemoulense]MDB9255727.1 hypothetical protein [Halorubrum ezzemoulense]MDB9276438.1 hypothetical protein [Halorubrum ezzemoulense]
MQRTRRALLGVGAALVGTAGCLGVEGVEYPDAPEAADAPGDGGDGGDADDPPEDPPSDDPADADGDPPVTNAALADATREVVDDAVWFATEYPDAVATYRDAVAEAVSTVRSVRATVDEEAAIATEQVDAVAAAGETAASRAAEALEPHFSPGSRIRDRVDRHVEVLREFAPRGDVDRALEELDRLRTGLAGMGTSLYVEEQFSRNPIHNRLFRRLLAPLPPDNPERGRVTTGTLVELAVASRGFSTFAHRPYDRDEIDRDRVPRIYGDALSADRRRELRARLGPIPRPADRVEELFFSFARRPPAGNRPEETFRGWARELDGVPVYVQRYPDAETADARLSTALDEGATEGRAPIDPEATLAGSDFSGNSSATGNGSATENGTAAAGGIGDDGGPTPWYRFYHREAEGERYGFDEHAGVQYGYLVRAGEFLLATGFSGDAWEERTGWHGRLRHGWVTGA